jgi:YD repeat-containing protein
MSCGPTESYTSDAPLAPGTDDGRHRRCTGLPHRVRPAVGGVPTTTVSDARGNTIALHQYRGPSPSGAADVSTYTYTPAGLVESVTGPDGATWRYT